ncbi:Gfo/Idh/MocA family protein [Sphingorhabdus sp.]|jgi:UDP-2-acetamido-3-amino-2,3-dideoxy-glucuronate N-acetyltransferase|uniref:Gfo/Idh/MocA family protein n=1 Tax=Sphingorhabdus sp. TaxID=1902408 RepID=UPI0035B29E1D|nr:Gfo/Idh/MocA family oxidoreductase [Sphingomonadaceae bacterium]
MIRIALAGCGGWGKNLARNLAELGALDLIVDPAPQAAELAGTLGVRHAAALDAALDDPAIDAIAVATPAATHVEVATSALHAGKHVYVEKPIALSIDEGEELKLLAESRGLTLMVGHLLQYHPVFQTLLALSRDAELGRISFIGSNRLNFGLLRSEENVAWSFAPHDISMVLALAGRRPLRVMANGQDILQAGIPDIATLRLDFGDGLISEIRASWLHPEKEQKLVVVGDAAMAVFSDREVWDRKLQLFRNEVLWDGSRPKAQPGTAEYVAIPPGEPLKAEMQHFIDCVARDESPRTDADEAIAVLAVLQAAQQSMDADGLWISL